MPRHGSVSALRYEFEDAPEAGASSLVLPGIRWLRMPLPFMLGHINLWLLADQGRWTIVDTGLGTFATQRLWSDVLERQLRGDRVGRVIATHLHPDHVGCAGWLVRHCGATLWMSREEYLLCRVLLSDTGQPPPAEGVAFYTAAGVDDGALERYESNFGNFGKVVTPLPPSYIRLIEDMILPIGDRQWRVMIGRGHSVEHICLFCEDLNVLISGDQILPTISSNVSVWPTEPLANPLADWIDSLRSLVRRLPGDVLVLPAHGKPFRGAHARLESLIQEHLVGLDALRRLCQEPIRAVDTFEVLFGSVITDSNLVMAVGEAVAHLNYLQQQGEIGSWLDDSGCRWYQTSG